MVDMSAFVLFLALAVSAFASPSPWLRHRHSYHPHHHRNRNLSITSSSTSPSSNSVEATQTSPSSSVVASSASFIADAEPVFPTLSVTSGSGADFPYATASSGAGTSTRKCSKRPSSGTAVGTASVGSLSARPTGYPNGTALHASSGLAPKSTQPASSSAVTPSSIPSSGSPYAGFLRGINIGGWLLLDSTLNANLLSAADAATQWAFDSSSASTAKLSDHWNSYFTKTDVTLLKSYGINALKIPIGYWAYDNSGTPYTKGADAYLESAIGWAENAGMKVWIDISNTQTIPEISADRALTHSLAILRAIATKYGSAAYANTVTGLQIFPSPIATPDQGGSAHDDFAKQAFDAIRAAAANPNLQVIMPDASASPSNWQPLAETLSPSKGLFSVAERMSELSCPCEQAMTQAQHIEAACQRGYKMARVNDLGISVYAGEFKPATNATIDVEAWTEAVVEDVRMYVEAQLQVFEEYTSGYFFWSWADETELVGETGWGFKQGVEKGYVPVPLDDKKQRKYPHQCDG